MHKNSPGWSSFRPLMDTWDAYLEREDRENRVNGLIDGNGLILFFRKGGSLFGAPEESRVTFARMKNPLDEEEGIMDQANFIAMNLLDTLSSGKESHAAFTAEDLPHIVVIPKEKCQAILMRHASKPTKGKKQKDDGFIKIDDEDA